MKRLYAGAILILLSSLFVFCGGDKEGKPAPEDTKIQIIK